MTENKPTVLYIDDEEVNLFLFKQLFQKEFDIATCVSADDALELLHTEESIKVIIVDMNMPDKNGLEFIQESKERYKNKDLTYVILTGYALNTEIKQALNSGAISKYLSKPFDVNAIVTLLNEYH